MPVLMDKTEWKNVVESASRSGHIWRQHVVGGIGESIGPLPATGAFEIMFIEIPPKSESATEAHSSPGKFAKPRISDFIGYGKRFHSEYRSTEDVMRELREGETE